MPAMLADEQIGGGTVRRTFKFGDTQVFAGHPLTAEQIIGIPRANRRALVEKTFIDIYPKPPTDLAPAHELPRDGERHVVSSGFGKFDVIEGRKLNSAPLTKDEAMTLAGKGAVKRKGKKGKKKPRSVKPTGN